jgi:hypothetical protein
MLHGQTRSLAHLFLAIGATCVLAACQGDGEEVPNRPPTIGGVPGIGVDAGSTYSFEPRASDPDGDTLTFSAANLPAWASINSSTGVVTGTPADADVGMTSEISIEVTDSAAVAQLEPFRIQVRARATTPTPPTPTPEPVNRAPTISGTPATTVVAGSAYTFQPDAIDADGNALTFSIDNRPTWATFSTSTGRLSGTPAAGNVGTTTGVVIRVSDGLTSTALPTFNLQVTATPPTNRAPVISGTPPTSVVALTAYAFTPSASDPDGTTLTFGVQNRPTWATFNTSTGRLSGTPTATQLGTFSNIRITVSDGTATVSLPAFAITVTQAANRAPVISGTPSTTATVGQAWSFTPTASDPDGNTLTFTATNRPSWLTLNATTGAMTGTPAAANVGTASNIVITVNDGRTSVSLAAFSITVAQVANRAPVISGTPSTTATVGQAWSFAPTASDPDGNTLTFSASNLPAWLTINATTGAVTGTPAAANVGTASNIVITVNDGRTSVSLAAFSITVTSVGNGTAELQWSAPSQNTDGTPLSDLAGFRVVYGRSQAALDQQVEIRNASVSTYTLQNLASGTWYFAVAAFTGSGAESDLSTIRSKSIP